MKYLGLAAKENIALAYQIYSFTQMLKLNHSLLISSKQEMYHSFTNNEGDGFSSWEELHIVEEERNMINIKYGYIHQNICTNWLNRRMFISGDQEGCIGNLTDIRLLISKCR